MSRKIIRSRVGTVCWGGSCPNRRRAAASERSVDVPERRIVALVSSVHMQNIVEMKSSKSFVGYLGYAIQLASTQSRVVLSQDQQN